MTVYLVGAGPGHPGLITRRGAELLGRAEVVVYDRLVSPALLDLAPPSAERVDVGKRPGQVNRQEEINRMLVEHGRAGRTVVRLKGGDPFVFGRGGEEATALLQAGVAFEVVPGVTAAFAAPTYAGVPVTHRGLAASVTVVTGRVEDPSSGGVDWEVLARAGGTLVILMGMENRAEIAARLVAGGRSPDTDVLVVQWGTTFRQQSRRATLASLADVELGSPATIVVGAVAGLDLTWPVPGPLAALTVVVTRAKDRAVALVAALEEAGAAVFELPVVVTGAPVDGGAALRAALSRRQDLAWTVFTSPVAVQRTLAELRDARDLAGIALAAVGPSTAEALAAHGLVADLVAEPADAEGLVAAMPQASGSAMRVLYPCSESARAVVGPGLAAKGWDVEQVVAYRTVPIDSAGEDDLESASRADVVTFTSPSTVSGFVGLMAGRHLPGVVACTGPVTAEAAVRAGLSVDVVADQPGVGGLVAALSSFMVARAR